jgi:hypothetical protein
MDISRRGLLLAAAGSAALTAAGCSAAAPPDPQAPPETPDDRARRSAADSELALIAAYRSGAKGGAEADRYAFFAAQHEKHLAALYPVDTPPAPAPAPGGAPAAARMRRMESAAARQRTQACLEAEDGSLIELLAKIAASEAGHAASLAGGAA